MIQKRMEELENDPPDETSKISSCTKITSLTESLNTISQGLFVVIQILIASGLASNIPEDIMKSLKGFMHDLNKVRKELNTGSHERGDGVSVKFNDRGCPFIFHFLNCYRLQKKKSISTLPKIITFRQKHQV